MTDTEEEGKAAKGLTDLVVAATRAHEAYLDALDERNRRLDQGHGRITEYSTLRDVQELLRRVDHLRMAINSTPVDGLRPRWDAFDDYLDEPTEKYWREQLGEIHDPVEDAASELVRLLREPELLQQFDTDTDGDGPEVSISRQMAFCTVVFQRITESLAGQSYVRNSMGTILAEASLPLIHPDRVSQILGGSPLSTSESGQRYIDPDRLEEVTAVVSFRAYGGGEIPALLLHASYLGQVLPLTAYGELGFENGARFAPLLERALEPLYPPSMFAAVEAYEVFDGPAAADAMVELMSKAADFDTGDFGDLTGAVGDIVGAVRGLCTTFASIHRVARNPTSIEDIGALTVAIIGSLQDARSVVTSVGYVTSDTAKTLARRTAWIAVPLLAIDTVTNLSTVRQALDDEDYLLAAGTLLVVGGSVTAGVATLGAAYSWGVLAGPVGAGIVTAGVLTVFIGQSLISLAEPDAIEKFGKACMFGADRQRIHVGIDASSMPAPGAADFEFHDGNGRHDPVRQLHALFSLGQPLGLAAKRSATLSNTRRDWSLVRHDGSQHPLGAGADWRFQVMTAPPTPNGNLGTGGVEQLVQTGASSTSRWQGDEVSEIRVVVPRGGVPDLVLYAYAKG